MTEDWGGAQWVLATLLAMGIVSPLMIRIAGLATADKTAVQWWGWYIGTQLERAGLVIILHWGGFWA